MLIKQLMALLLTLAIEEDSVNLFPSIKGNVHINVLKATLGIPLVMR